MRYLSRFSRGRKYLIAFTAGVLVLGGVVTTQMATAAPALPVGATGVGHSSATTASAGTMVTGKTYAKQPALTAAQQKQVQAGMATSYRPGPAFPVYKGPVPKPAGPGFLPPTANATPPGTFKVFRNTTLPAGGQFSGVGEPSTAGSGRHVFQSGNWYAAYSHNNGTNWTYLNPFSIFGGGYCCDQVTVTDTTHERVFWLLQYGDHITIANSSISNLASWCFYNFTPGQVGLTGGSFDFNHMTVDANNVFWSTDVYGVTGVASLVERLPIDAMVNCAGFGWSFITRGDTFAPSFVQTTGDVQYWGSDNTNLGLGNGFRVFSWQDQSGSYSIFDRGIDPFTYMSQGSGKCASPDGVVTNWCWFDDSRMAGGGYLGIPSIAEQGSFGVNANDTIIGFAMAAQQDGGHPFPFTRRIYFRASDMTYLGYSEDWGSFAAFIYPDMAANGHGDVGMVMAWGGGTGTTHYYPGIFIVIDDDFSPAQPFAYSYVTSGAGNACDAGTNQPRWGDYLSIRAWNPTRNVWMASGYALTANASGGCGVTQPIAAHNIVFGRVRDAASYYNFSKTSY